MSEPGADLARPGRAAPAGQSATSAGRILLLVLLAGVGLRLAFVHPARNYLLDFRSYYAAGAAIDHGINPYDIETIHERLPLPGRQPVFYYPYPPPSLAWVYPFAQFSYPLAQIPWCLFQFALAVAALVILLRATNVAFGSPTSVLLTATFLLSSAVAELFRWGQFDMIILALLAGAYWCLARGRSVSAGALIGLAAVAKVTPCVYLVVFVVRRDFRALFAGLAAIAIPMAVTYPLIGDDGMVLWFGHLTRKLGQVAHLISPENMSLHGFVYRALVDHPSLHGPSHPWLDLGPNAAKMTTLGVIGLMWLVTGLWMLRNRTRLSTCECLAATVPVLLMMAPITWTHHCVQLLLPLAVIAALLARRALRPLDTAWVALILLCLTMWPVQRFQLELPDPVRHLFAPTVTYAGLLTWGFMVLRYVPLKVGVRQTTREQSRQATALGGLLRNIARPAG